MHEIGMCEGLVELIEQQAGGRRVTGARVRVGVRHAVVDDAFGQAFTLATTGTAAQDAVVELVITPMTVGCRACGSRSTSMDVLAACPRCGDEGIDLSGGDELVLESVTYGEEVSRVSRHPR
ncbi:hydrogenase maturation nickel metallochaperone HypA [Nonomuraea sp. K274]|uniref:Hydrogenase maturation factor HypA n=1 Tax=Nonomuraea cypriaca TaxID=1187855 RepID=A0A931A832_9ACTN|nr:hydrogenase maturation nickel metallochaperone HypA [Nonomuraea cypriaca]MBF8187996.1 hydrogenase maturation nickel metallochaperone HypA [Nonomuraea cypriaca]